MSTTHTTASAQWDSMTDQKKIEWLAKIVYPSLPFKRLSSGLLICVNPENPNIEESFPWNPLTNWNHWREVEVEAVRNYKTWHEFMHILGINTTGTNVPADCSKMYVRTPLANRAKALFLASQ